MNADLTCACGAVSTVVDFNISRQGHFCFRCGGWMYLIESLRRTYGEFVGKVAKAVSGADADRRIEDAIRHVIGGAHDHMDPITTVSA